MLNTRIPTVRVEMMCFCRALSMNGASIMGRKLVVMYAQPSKEVKRRPSQDLIEDGM